MSIGFNIRWVGLNAFRKRMSGAGKRVESELEKNMRKAGEYVIGASRKQFHGSRTSIYRNRDGSYKKRAKSLKFVKSPKFNRAHPKKLAIWTQKYSDSISQDVRRVGRHKWTTEVGPTVWYAELHEKGIGGMPKRQVLTPGVKDSEAAVFRVIGTTFRVV